MGILHLAINRRTSYSIESPLHISENGGIFFAHFLRKYRALSPSFEEQARTLSTMAGCLGQKSDATVALSVAADSSY